MPSPINLRPVVAAFDFDVTITTRDTFVPFLYRAFGNNKVCSAFFRLTPEAAKVFFGFSTRDVFKAKLIQALFTGESSKRLHAVGLEHASEILNWVRPEALKRIAWHKERGDRLIMVSASLDIYLEPVAKALGFDDLLCTRPSLNHDVFDGSMMGNNCRCAEKVSRLQSLLGDLSLCELHAYGDSAGDTEMLKIALHSHYRAFEPGGEFHESTRKDSSGK